MRPSTCSSVNTGTSAAMMISIANSVGFATCSAARMTRRSMSRALGRPLVLHRVQHVLDQHHRAVDQDAEVDRAHRDQVGRQLERVKADEGAEQRERDHRADDQRAGDAAEEEPRHRDHQQEAVQQVVVDRASGVVPTSSVRS